MQFDAKSSWFKEKNIHGTIIRGTLSFLYRLLTSYSSILLTVSLCGTMSTNFPQELLGAVLAIICYNMVLYGGGVLEDVLGIEDVQEDTF